jgi:hypothetical protein
MRIFFAIIFILTLTQVQAQTCQPVIDIANSTITTVKEGHDQKTKLVDVTVEMDRYCPGEAVSMTLLVLSESAVVGEHLQIAEVNTLVIPAGQISSSLSIGIIGDDDWNEDRTFSVKVINPTHGSVNLAQTSFVITNDDPKITMIIPEKVKEPRLGSKEVPLRLVLSMPADRLVTGEIEIRGLSATQGDDFSSSHSIGFELLPGETTFEFLPNSFAVLSDDLKEKSEHVTFFMNTVKGASAYPEQVNLFIEDPAPQYRATIESVVSGVADARVAMISTYKHTLELTESAENSGLFQSETSAPSYSHRLVGVPMTPVTRPGLVAANAIIKNDLLERFRFEFVVSPVEIYPYSPQVLYMFMSSFGKLHEDEFISITRPGSSSFPAFDFKAMKKTGEKTWEGLYKRSLRDGGSEALREVTKLKLEEI